MQNKDMRAEIKKAGLKQWQVSEAMHMHDSNFCKLLRKELTQEQKAKIRSIITQLKEVQ